MWKGAVPTVVLHVRGQRCLEKRRWLGAEAVSGGIGPK